MTRERKSFGNTTKLGSLLDRIQAGDQAAHEELIEEAQERLRRMASKMLSGFPQLREQGRAETGMVLNDVLMSLYKSFNDVKFDSPRHFINLAATKIRRCLIDLKRKHQREIEKMGEQLATVGGNVQESGSLSTEDWAAFHEAVEKLPSEEKEVFSLRYYGGWSREEAATIVGVAEKTVTRRYGRATQTLATLLE